MKLRKLPPREFVDSRSCEIEIGFKSVFLLEILANISSQDVMVELADPTRAGLFLPVIPDSEAEDLLMLLMPMMINT